MSECDARIALIGDYDKRVMAHQAIPRAIELASAAEDSPVEFEWLATERITHPLPSVLSRYRAIWVVPNSPYHNAEGVIAAIQFARETGIPFLGTCGGFQHAVIEFARHVAGIGDAAHAEEHPNAESKVISALSCSLVEKSGEVRFAHGSRLRMIYGANGTVEGYHCNYGLNANYRSRLESAGMQFSATDAAGDVRAFELPDHPFFFGTLFQPERSARLGHPPPLVRAFLKAAQLKQ